MKQYTLAIIYFYLLWKISNALALLPGSSIFKSKPPRSKPLLRSDLVTEISPPSEIIVLFENACELHLQAYNSHKKAYKSCKKGLVYKEKSGIRRRRKSEWYTQEADKHAANAANTYQRAWNAYENILSQLKHHNPNWYQRVFNSNTFSHNYNLIKETLEMLMN